MLASEMRASLHTGIQVGSRDGWDPRHFGVGEPPSGGGRDCRHETPSRLVVTLASRQGGPPYGGHLHDALANGRPEVSRRKGTMAEDAVCIVARNERPF